MMPRHEATRKLGILLPCTLLVVACAGGRPSERTISQMIEASSKFRTPYVTYVPKQIVLIPRVVRSADGQQMAGMMNAAYRKPSLEPEDVSHIDGSVAILRQVGLVAVSDASNAVAVSMPGYEEGLREADGHISWYAEGRARTHDMYGHVITVQRREASGEAAKDWHDDEDGPDDDYYHGFTGIRTTPGWRVEIARRELVRIDEIVDETSVNDEVRHGEILVKFTYRWVPTASGEAFVPGTDANAALPPFFRYLSPLGGGALRAKEVRAHLILKKTDKGWKPASLAAGWKGFGGPDAPL